jgi:hypothetical protein
VFATNDSTPGGDKRLVTKAGKTKEATADAAVHVDLTPKRSQVIVADAFKANWVDTMDHRDHGSPTPLLYRYFGSSSARRCDSQARCVCRMTTPRMYCLPSDRPPVVLADASSVKATNSHQPGG